MRMYQGRMMYPSYVGGRRHPRAGRPHPFLYANAGNRRTRAHAYYGTQPTGYGIRGGDPRYSGIAGSAGRVYQHMLAGSYRPPRPSQYWVSKLTPQGRIAQRQMAGQKRDFRSETARNRREFRRGQRALKNQIRDIRRRIPQLQGVPFGGLASGSANKQIARLHAQLKSQGASYRSSYKQRLANYRNRRRTTATKSPMYAAVRRHPWHGYSGWRPTRRRTWGNYRGINWGRRRRYA